MQIQVNTDRNIEGHEALATHVRTVLGDQIGRFSEHVTRVEVHVSDVNSHKTTDGDKRCLMEARVAGRQPIAVSENAGNVRQAVDGAAHKLKRALDSTLGKLASRERG
ncbi:MAG: HPF/RaiA family ribosome-associated protein [Gammaproteobacteria bacterium]|nr:HPF/RaiA family ribosome-associated protein [Gammaproteobacteria bacterium]